uniref:Uncharacterized protein n=1 Tax=Ascaris lumbricoides TaxID=6252 RepID=A0A0M3I951_ASCLU
MVHYRKTPQSRKAPRRINDSDNLSEISTARCIIHECSSRHHSVSTLATIIASQSSAKLWRISVILRSVHARPNNIREVSMAQGRLRSRHGATRTYLLIQKLNILPVAPRKVYSTSTVVYSQISSDRSNR